MGQTATQTRVAPKAPAIHAPRGPEAVRPFAAEGPGVEAGWTPGPAFSFGRLPIQAKLVVGQPGDALEEEADQVADRVMRMPDPTTGGVLQRRCATCEEAGRAPANVIQRAEGGDGPALPPLPSYEENFDRMTEVLAEAVQNNIVSETQVDRATTISRTPAIENATGRRVYLIACTVDLDASGMTPRAGATAVPLKLRPDEILVPYAGGHAEHQTIHFADAEHYTLEKNFLHANRDYCTTCAYWARKRGLATPGARVRITRGDAGPESVPLDEVDDRELGRNPRPRKPRPGERGEPRSRGAAEPAEPAKAKAEPKATPAPSRVSAPHAEPAVPAKPAPKVSAAPTGEPPSTSGLSGLKETLKDATKLVNWGRVLRIGMKSLEIAAAVNTYLEKIDLVLSAIDFDGGIMLLKEEDRRAEELLAEAQDVAYQIDRYGGLIDTTAPRVVASGYAGAMRDTAALCRSMSEELAKTLPKLDATVKTLRAWRRLDQAKLKEVTRVSESSAMMTAWCMASELSGKDCELEEMKFVALLNDLPIILGTVESALEKFEHAKAAGGQLEARASGWALVCDGLAPVTKQANATRMKQDPNFEFLVALRAAIQDASSSLRQTDPARAQLLDELGSIAVLINLMDGEYPVDVVTALDAMASAWATRINLYATGQDPSTIDALKRAVLGLTLGELQAIRRAYRDVLQH